MRMALVNVLALTLVIPASALLAGRAVLPDTACSVSAGQVAAVKLHMDYPAVKAKLGCDGAHELEFDIGGLRGETYIWRGSAWPFSTFKAHFYNGVLHATETLTVSLDITVGPPQVFEQDERG